VDELQPALIDDRGSRPIESLTVPPLPSDPAPPPRRRSWIVIAGASLAIVLVVGGVLVALAQRDETAPQRAAESDENPVADEVPLIPPRDLEGKARPSKVALSWLGPASWVEEARYEIRRNDTFIGYVDPPRKRFIDDEVAPGTDYTYEVRVEGPDGTFSDAVSVELSTPLPPLAEARVEGTFDVRSKITDETGYGDYTAPGFGWTLRPACGSGPCGFTLRDIVRDDLKLSLTRQKLTYTGTFSERFEIQCEGTGVISNGTVVLRVAKARVLDGEWRATRLTGTLSHQEAAQLGCRSSSATLSLTATLYT
jgi:hypothetical protein